MRRTGSEWQGSGNWSSGVRGRGVLGSGAGVEWEVLETGTWVSEKGWNSEASGKGPGAVGQG